MEVFLVHHGIKGQKWGVRKERQKTAKRTNKRKKNIGKKIAIGSAIVVGTALAAYGGYKIFKNKKYIKSILKGTKAVNKMGINTTKKVVSDSFSNPSVNRIQVPKINVPRVDIPKTNIQRTEVPKASVPHLTLNPKNVSIGEDYTKRILDSSTKLSSAIKETADMKSIFGSLDSLTEELLKKA